MAHFLRYFKDFWVCNAQRHCAQHTKKRELGLKNCGSQRQITFRLCYKTFKNDNKSKKVCKIEKFLNHPKLNCAKGYEKIP